MTFRQQCALVLLEKWADKIFDRGFQRESIDAGLEPVDLLAAYIAEATDAMAETFT